MVTARSQPANLARYQFDGIYVPREVSGYLLATLPTEQRPPTTRRIMRWIRSGLVAPGRSNTPGREVTIDFEGLVTCQAVTLLREAGISLADIRRAEQYFSKRYSIVRPFSHRRFWHSGRDVLGRWEGLLISGSPGGQIAWEFLRQWLTPLPLHLEFSGTTDRADCWRPTEGVSLKPDIQFGQPCLDGTRIPTGAIWGYVNAGDSPEFIAQAYRLGVIEVERAVRWEERVRAALDASAAVPA